MFLLSFWIYLFFLFSRQEKVNDFERWYFDFHVEWSQGTYIDLKELEELFEDCPDKTQFPHYFYYKGWIFYEEGFEDLALESFLLYEKFLHLGFEKEELGIKQHKSHLHYSLAVLYAEMEKPQMAREYLAKGRALMDEKTDYLLAEYDFDEMEARINFEFTSEKKQAIDCLESLYRKVQDNDDFSITRLVTLYCAIDYSVEVNDMKRASELINLWLKDSNIEAFRNSDYLTDYYSIMRNYFEAKFDYKTALQYNDSILLDKNVNLLKRETLHKAYIRIYDSLKQYDKVLIFKDSLEIIRLEQQKIRKNTIVNTTFEKKELEDYSAFILRKKKKEERGWILLTSLTLSLILIVFISYRKKKINSEKQLSLEKEKVEFTQKKYLELLKKYQFDKKHLERLKLSLMNEVKRNPTSQICLTFDQINRNIETNSLSTNYDILQFEADFSTNLKQKIPDLTPFEIQISYYLKMNFTIKEIAKMTNCSYKSIESHKYRIVKKFKVFYTESFDTLIKKMPLNTSI